MKETTAQGLLLLDGVAQGCYKELNMITRSRYDCPNEIRIAGQGVLDHARPRRNVGGDRNASFATTQALLHSEVHGSPIEVVNNDRVLGPAAAPVPSGYCGCCEMIECVPRRVTSEQRSRSR